VINKDSLKLATVVVVVSVVVSGGSYYLGFQTGLDQTKNIVVENVTNIDTPEDITADFSLFWEVWGKLKEEHIKGAEIDEQELVYGAIEGLTSALGDPNTVFFAPDESKKFNEDIRGNFSGIGAEIGIRDNRLVIIAPLKNTPAEQAGLRPGDHIFKIDDTTTDDINVEEAVKLIRGDTGTIVTLTIIREGEESSRTFDITRASIIIPTVEWEIIDRDIIHLRMFSFSGNTPIAFQQAMVSALLAGGDGLILDLRGNPGGFLDISVRIAGFFLERGQVVVTEKFTSGSETVLRARGNEALRDFPVVILIDEGSASASEILAGALRVHNGTKIVGDKSFGKGTVQELQDLRGDSTLKITIANWLLPNGDLIEGNGLEPDVSVKITQEDIDNDRDPQLDEAIRIINVEISE